MVRRHARRLAVGSAARSAFTAQVAFTHLLVSFDASHPLQCPRAACRLAEQTVLTSQRGSSTGSTKGLASIGPHASSSVLFRTQCTLTESGVATSFGAHLHNAIAACYISKIQNKYNLAVNKLCHHQVNNEVQFMAVRSDSIFCSSSGARLLALDISQHHPLHGLMR